MSQQTLDVPPHASRPTLSATPDSRTDDSRARRARQGLRLLGKIGLPAILASGVFLRLYQYAFNRSLWHDEAQLALNLFRRSFGGFLQPLEYDQAAPAGFLILTKGVTLVLGTGEYALRLLPLLCGLGALLLFYPVARRWLSDSAVPVALLLFAFSPALIWYSAEFKQYSTDVLLGVTALLAALPLLDDRLTRSRAALLAGGGALGLWISHPLVFVLGGLGIALGLRFARTRDRRSLFLLALVAGVWLGSFAVEYLVTLREVDKVYLRDFWDYGFVPWPPTSVPDVVDWARRFKSAFDDPLGLEFAYAGGVLFLIGSIRMIRRRWNLFLALCLPVPLALVASGLEWYPFARRLLLFLVPALILVTAEGMGSLWDRGRTSLARALALVVIGIVVWGPMRESLAVPYTHHEARPAIERLARLHRSGDVVYVYYKAMPAYRYYTRSGLLADADVRVGEEHREDPTMYRPDLERLRGNARVWILFSHVYLRRGPGDEETLFVEHLDAIGSRLLEFQEDGAALYLYDMRGAPRPPTVDGSRRG